MNYKEVIDNIYNEVKPFFGKGHVADYIPALANIDPKQYGIAIATLDGQIVGTGDYQTKFSIQSISKVFTLAMVATWGVICGNTWDGNLPELHLTRWFSWNMNKEYRVIRLSTPELSWLRIK